jgi:hypothetical protein
VLGGHSKRFSHANVIGSNGPIFACNKGVENKGVIS